MLSEADAKMDIIIGNALRIGVSIAALVVFSGWVLYVARAHGAAPDYRHFHGRPLSPDHLASMFSGVRSLDSRSIIELGILLLIATPLTRVILCIGAFAAEKDKVYVLVSSVVLAILIYSLFFRS